MKKILFIYLLIFISILGGSEIASKFDLIKEKDNSLIIRARISSDREKSKILSFYENIDLPLKDYKIIVDKRATPLKSIELLTSENNLTSLIFYKLNSARVRLRDNYIYIEGDCDSSIKNKLFKEFIRLQQKYKINFRLYDR